MKVQFSRLRSVLSAATLALVVATSSAATVSAAPNHKVSPPKSGVSGQQDQPPVEPGKNDAKTTDNLGPTTEVQANQNAFGASPNAISALTGTVSNVDFSTFYDYCYKNLTYTTVHNSSSATKYVHIVFYNGTSSRDLYTSIAAGVTAFPAFYGVNGSYSAYLYVWNGSSYTYDEYKAGNNTCNVSVSRVYNSGGWVELKIQNTGTAYASQVSTELAPYPSSGTYTGTHYDYPTAGGSAIYRWFYVGTQPYGIVSTTSGSYLYPALFYGDL